MAKKSPAKKPARKKPARKKKVTPIPTDFPAVSAHLIVASVKKAADFYQKAFGFELLGPPMMAGKVMVHAVLGHAGSAVMLGSPAPDGSHKTPADQKLKGQSFGLYAYVKDVDAQYKRIKRFKGLQVTAPQDVFWGDRMFDVVDRDGHCWTFASRKSMPTPEEMAAAMQAMMAG